MSTDPYTADRIRDLEAKVRALTERAEKAEKRLKMARSFSDGGYTLVLYGRGTWQVSRWNPKTRDSDYLAPNGTWVAADDNDNAPLFPDQDSAFAALAAKRKS